MLTTTVFILLLVASCFLVGILLVSNVQRAGQMDPRAPRKIRSFPNNYEADLLVAQLAELGIEAKAVGGFVSGFQAESPGYVDVVVANQDFENAQQLLELPKSATSESTD